VESLKSLLADFALPQKDAAILNSAKSLSLTVDAYPDRVFDGKVSSVDPRVDEDTLTISGRGVFDNPNEELLNGMNGVVTINLGADKPVVVVPSIAIVYNAYGTFVYVVDDQKDAKTGKISHVVKQQFVKVGQTKGDYSAISEGLKAGDVVVSVGQMKLRNGIAVEIDNTQKPQMSENPTPEES
jgi:membrane fusion protein (multidrug efflux system)